MSADAGIAAETGVFDGVHLGHASMLEALHAYAAARGMRTRVYTFRNHPLTSLRPQDAPQRLTTAAQRATLIRACNIDSVVDMDFDSIRSLTAAGFLARLRDNGVRTLLMGFNNHIGCDRCNAAEAAEKGIIDIVPVEPLPQLAHISSSAVRATLAQGNVAAASHMLGRQYCVDGTVEHGRAIGHTIGFPTANLGNIPQMLPADGVYAADVTVPGQTMRRRAVANIGMRPTVNGTSRTVEVHIPDFSGDIYGYSVNLAFLARLRDERRFDSLDALKAAIAADCAAATEL